MFHEPWKRSWALIKKKKKGLYKKKKTENAHQRYRCFRVIETDWWGVVIILFIILDY